MAKYLSDEIISKAEEFDKVVGASVKMLGLFGVCAIPSVKSALFFHYCKENEHEIDAIVNTRETVVMLTSLELELLKLLY
jgi:hypothetical protein